MNYYELPNHCPNCGIETQREGLCAYCFKLAMAETKAEESERA